MKTTLTLQNNVTQRNLFLIIAAVAIGVVGLLIMFGVIDGHRLWMSLKSS